MGPFMGTAGLGRCGLSLFKEASERAEVTEVAGTRSQRACQPSETLLSVVLSDGKVLEGFAPCCNTI